MADIDLPDVGESNWGPKLNTAIDAVNTEVEAVADVANAAVPNTPEGRTALAESVELSGSYVKDIGEPRGRIPVARGSNTDPLFIDGDAWVDAFGADPSGASDSTAAFVAAKAYLDSLPYRGTFRLGSGIYAVDELVIGTSASGQGRNYGIKGMGQQRTFLRSWTASKRAIIFNGSADLTGDVQTIEDLTLLLHTSRAFDLPIIDFRHTRMIQMNRVGMKSGTPTSTTSYLGLFVRFESSYCSSWNQSLWTIGKYAVPLEITAYEANPIDGGQEQIDNWKFSEIVVGGCGPIIVRRNTSTEQHSLTLRNHKQSASSYYPNVDIASPSTLSVNASAGDTTITLANASDYVAGDAILIDVRDNIEMSRIESISGNVLTLSRPLRFAHTAPKPVIRAGAVLSISNVNLVEVRGLHLENQWVGVLLGACKVAMIDHVAMGSGNSVAIVGPASAVSIDHHVMDGLPSTNRLLYVPNSSWGVDLTGMGPFEIGSGLREQSGSAAMQIEPSSGNPYWTAASRSVVPAGATNKSAQDHFHAPNFSGYGSNRTKRVTNGGTLSEVSYETYSGQAWFGDGVGTKVISGASKTTVSDGDFTVTPPDGTVAIVLNSSNGSARLAARVNGSWIYSNLT